MKKIGLLLIVVLVFSCNTNKAAKAKENPIQSAKGIDNFDWLLGNWKRSNEMVGKETFESWKKISDREYIGSSYTTQKTDTIYSQSFKLIKENDSWSFQIKLKGETTPSSFKMTRSNAQEFVCENNQKNYPNKKLDSPNKIKYWTKNNGIYATISGKNIHIQLDFERFTEL